MFTARTYHAKMFTKQRFADISTMPKFDPSRPFNELPLLPPNTDIETRSILKQCIEARSALAELKQAGELIPNQDVLINTIPLREAKDSSAIENIVTTDDKLFRHAAMQEKDADSNTKETLRYRRALLEGYRTIRSRPLTTATAVKVCQTIRGIDINVRNTSGTALKNTATGKIIYTPPEGERLLFKKLGNWESFLHEKTDIDPLVRMAVGHYQFEAIHPFTDGNGRTGRLLNILFLIGENLLDIPVLYLSRYIIENKDDYYSLLQEVTEANHWEPWIRYMLSAVEKTAKWTTEKIRAIKDLMEHTSSYTNAAKPNVYTRELVELTFIQPYCRIAHVIDAGIAQRATASKYLRELCAIGVLKEITIGRDKVFIHPKFLNLLIRESNDFPLYGNQRPGS